MGAVVTVGVLVPGTEGDAVGRDSDGAWVGTDGSSSSFTDTESSLLYPCLREITEASKPWQEFGNPTREITKVDIKLRPIIVLFACDVKLQSFSNLVSSTGTGTQSTDGLVCI